NGHLSFGGDWRFDGLVRVRNASLEFKNCTFRENSTQGTYSTTSLALFSTASDHGANNADDNIMRQFTLRNCLVVKNTIKGGGNTGVGSGGGYIVCGMGHVWKSTTQNILVEGCTIADNTLRDKDGGGNTFLAVVAAHALSPNAKVKDSIIYNNNTPTVTNWQSNAGHTAASLWWCDLSYSIVAVGTQLSTVGAGVIDQNPSFVDTANLDYLLQAGSPAIDAGDPSSNKDSDGSRADMGYRPSVSEATSLTEDFDGNLDQNWTVERGNVALQDGTLRSSARGTILSRQEYPAPKRIRTRVQVHGGGENTVIMVATNGEVANGFNELSGLGVILSKHQNRFIIMQSLTDDWVIASVEVTIQVNKWYDIDIIDTGSTITATLDDTYTLTADVSDIDRPGSQVAYYSREIGAGSSLDYFYVSDLSLNDGLVVHHTVTQPAIDPEADTDGDGVLDIHETGTGTFASDTDTGSDPRVADT
ncbi:MAG: hypothetical protein GY917_14925, partial [Planctomycetaceae bacterium]|nr:hypothetical protein [Planctomycetaceae bacterium]